MGIYSIVVATIAGIIIVGASFFALSQQQNEPAERSRAGSFGGPTNVFDILNRPDTQSRADIDTSTSIVQNETLNDRAALQALADAWKNRRIELEKALPAQTPSVTTASAPTEPKDIFAELLGPKLTDALNNRSTTNDTQPSYTSTSFDGETALWGGAGEVARTQPIQPVDTTYTIQTELHDYGNVLGATLDTFVQSQGDQSATLSFYLEHRSDTVAKEKLRALTDAYAQLSEQLSTITVPTPLAQNHTHLVTGYARIGTGLWKITDATTDGELYNKLIAYNAVAEDVARYHITVITVLKAYGVTFAPGEPGNAFVFDGAQGSSVLSL